MKNYNLEFICKNVVELCHETGKFILEERGKFKSSSIEVKGQNDFVSYVDKTSEKKLIAKLSEFIPESGFIAEENTIDKKGEHYTWIIDPLDGTTNFIHGLACFCISIALKKNDELVLGVIYEINAQESFYAWENSPAYLNGKAIQVSAVSKLKDSLLATGFPYYDYSRHNEYIELFKYYMQHTHGIRRLGSAAADLAYVACGRLDGFYEYGLKPWDVAAGIFIVQQAGGKISDFKGENNYLFGAEIVASNELIFDEFADSVKKHFTAQ